MCPGRNDCPHNGWQQWEKEPQSLAEVAKKTGLPWGKWLLEDARTSVESQWKQRPPRFKGKQVKLEDIAGFVVELLSTNAFDSGPRIPWIDFTAPGDGKVVAITQRQLAYLVANALMGNTISGKDGLSAALVRCSAKRPAPQGYLFSLLSFLAVLSQELTNGSQGRTLIAATPGGPSDAWKDKLADTKMSAPSMCASEAGGANCGLADFMSGGTEFQAVTDMAGEVVGGGAELCDLATSQDESLVQFYSEALAFSFFAGNGGRLPVPWTLLGARRYLRDLSGQSGAGAPYYGLCGGIRFTDWLNEDIVQAEVEVPLDRNLRERVHSYAFVAVGSKCSGCMGCKVDDAVQNKCPEQRNHVDADINLWYQAYEPTMYNPWVQAAFRLVIRRIGTGPWGAGVWYGDSQQYFLAAWLGTALLNKNDIKLDYYVYSKFCENPGNQCYVLGDKGCQACLANSSGNQYPVPASRCGKQSAQDMVFKFGGGAAMSLYQQLGIQAAPTIIASVDYQVFDLLANVTSPSGSILKIKSPAPPNGMGMIAHEKWTIKQGGTLQHVSGRCIDAPEPMKPGSGVHMWDCYDSLPSQQWIYDQGTGHIRNSAGICLDTEDPSKDGSALRLAACSEQGHQKWLVNAETGLLQNKEGKCIDAPMPVVNGGEVHLWQCFPKLDSQKWVHKEPGSGIMLIKDWRGLCLAVAAASTGSATLTMEGCDDKLIARQGWVYSSSTGLMQHGQQCLTSATPMRPGTAVSMAPCDAHSQQQQWSYTTEGAFRHAHGICLDAPEPDVVGSAVHMWPCYATLGNQQWVQDDAVGLVRNRHGFCLDASMPSIKGSIVRMAACHAELQSQHWHYEEGTGLIKTQYGSCLQSADATKQGSDLAVSDCDSTKPNQRWLYDDASGTIRHPGGLCIDTPDATKEQGAVHLWTCFDHFPSQEWV